MQMVLKSDLHNPGTSPTLPYLISAISTRVSHTTTHVTFATIPLAVLHKLIETSGLEKEEFLRRFGKAKDF